MHGFPNVRLILAGFKAVLSDILILCNLVTLFLFSCHDISLHTKARLFSCGLKNMLGRVSEVYVMLQLANKRKDGMKEEKET